MDFPISSLEALGQVRRSFSDLQVHRMRRESCSLGWGLSCYIAEKLVGVVNMLIGGLHLK